MLTMSERQQIANNLYVLRDNLLAYRESTVRDLPKPLEAKVRESHFIGPITSSGLEKVGSVISRIQWAAYYLDDPDFPANRQKRPPVAAETKSHLPLTPTQPPVSPKDNGLDFGPFDPRGAN